MKVASGKSVFRRDSIRRPDLVRIKVPGVALVDHCRENVAVEHNGLSARQCWFDHLLDQLSACCCEEHHLGSH